MISQKTEIILISDNEKDELIPDRSFNINQICFDILNLYILKKQLKA